MLKENKKIAVQNIKELFQNNSSAIIFHYKGLNVADMNLLRDELLKNNSVLKVVKNTLTLIALKDLNITKMEALFKGPSCIVWGNDPVDIAKVLSGFAKKNNNLVLIGGLYSNKILNEADLKFLSSLPSFDAIRSMLVAIIQTPATNIASILQRPAAMLANVLKQYSEK